MNGLVASDYTVVMLQSEPFCYDALDRYIETLQIIQEKGNPSLHTELKISAAQQGRKMVEVI